MCLLTILTGKESSSVWLTLASQNGIIQSRLTRGTNFRAGLMPTASVKPNWYRQHPRHALAPEYIPPEQAFAKPIDRWIYMRYGVIFYEMLVGRKPFSAENAQGMYLAHLYEAPNRCCRSFPHLDISKKVDDLIMSLMQKLPEIDLNRLSRCSNLSIRLCMRHR